LALHAASINSAQLFTLDSPTTPALCLPPFATNFFSLFPQALLALRSAGHASVLERHSLLTQADRDGKYAI